MNWKTIGSRENIWLAIIIAAGCFLRFYKLAYQSFWLDELHTAIETDSSLSWTDLLHYLKCCDQHPPLFFATEKIVFLLFGNNEFNARAVSAIAGTLSLWVIFLLGKEFYSTKLGLVASAITCINYFHIEYSQEARPYAFAFLFSSLSFLYLVRLIKKPVWKNSAWYACATLLMLGSHYFGLFALLSQIIIILVFLISEKEMRKKLFMQSLLSGLIIAIGFSPWFPYLFAMSSIKSFWLPPVSQGFAIDFFYEYFGNTDLIKPFLYLLLISALIHLFIKIQANAEDGKRNIYSFAFLFLFLWIVCTYFFPYLRSVLVVPTLHPRYTIVILPAFILLLAFGIELIQSRILKYSILIIFCLVSLTDLFIVKKYYSEISKTQFRELASFIAKDPDFAFPVVSEISAWHQQYYFRKNNYQMPVLAGKKEVVIDSILHKTSFKYQLDGFWISDAHGAEKPSTQLREKINASYVLICEKNLFDAWAQLYVSRDSINNKFSYYDHQAFPSEQQFLMDGDTLVPIWDKYAISNPFQIKKGNYRIDIMLKGQKAKDQYPHLNFYLGEKFIGTCFATKDFENYSFSFQTETEINTKIRIEMDNDESDPQMNEDRNAFVKSVLLIKVK